MSLTKKLYQIIKEDEGSFLLKLCDRTHPMFEAHFPNNPILAGFLQIDIAKEIYQLSFKKLKKVKFMSIIKPNDTINYIHKEDIKKIIISKNNAKVSEIIYE